MLFFLEFVLARFLHHMMTPSKEKHRALVYLCRHLHGTKHYINPSWEFPPNLKYCFFFRATWMNIQCCPEKNSLVNGFNPFETYVHQIGSSPQVRKCLKPPPSSLQPFPFQLSIASTTRFQHHADTVETLFICHINGLKGQ